MSLETRQMDKWAWYWTSTFQNCNLNKPLYKYSSSSILLKPRQSYTEDLWEIMMNIHWSRLIRMLLLWINVRTLQQEGICKQVKYRSSDGLNMKKWLDSHNILLNYNVGSETKIYFFFCACFVMISSWYTDLLLYPTLATLVLKLSCPQ